MHVPNDALSGSGCWQQTVAIVPSSLKFSERELAVRDHDGSLVLQHVVEARIGGACVAQVLNVLLGVGEAQPLSSLRAPRGDLLNGRPEADRRRECLRSVGGVGPQRNVTRARHKRGP